MIPDVYFLRAIFNFGSTLGIFPYKYKSVALRTVLISILLIYTTYSVIIIFSNIHKDLKDDTINIRENLLDIMVINESVCFHLLNMFTVTRYTNSWKKLMRLINFINKNLRHNINTIIHSIKIIMFLLIYLSTNYFYILEPFNNVIDVLLGFFDTMVYGEVTLSTVLYWEVLKFLEIRYVLLKKLANGLFLHHSRNGNYHKTLLNIKTNVFFLHQVTIYLNKVLGKQILVLVLLSFSQILGFYNSSLTNKVTTFILIETPEIFLPIIFSVVIILACDKVEKRANDLIRTCRYIQATKGDEIAGALANLAFELRPKFTAAGFFNINQGLLTTFFSTLSTYLIIILQFKLS